MKIATAQSILRRLSNSEEKQAGMMLPIAAGAGLLATAEGVKKTVEKSREHHAGFNPNYIPGAHG